VLAALTEYINHMHVLLLLVLLLFPAAFSAGQQAALRLLQMRCALAALIVH
jgi:hypothetical protein